jgi:putative transposase
VSAIQAERQRHLSVRAACRVLGVSHSGSYDWRTRAPSARATRNAWLSEKIHQVRQASDQTYGMPGIHAQLRMDGQRVSRKRVARLMRNAHIRGVSRRRAFTLTTERNARQRPAPDLVKRCFGAHAPDHLWVADMTYLPTWTGFVYLAVVIDAFSRKVVGWSMSEHMTTELVLAALNMALQTRKPECVIHHSDQGSQYTSIAFGDRCRQMGVRPSMGTVADAYDNAMAESFFASLECELIARGTWTSKTQAKTAVFTWIEAWYNPRRLHSALGYLSPNQYEEKQRATNHRAHEHGLPTAPLGSSQAPTGAVDNPAPVNA